MLENQKEFVNGGQLFCQGNYFPNGQTGGPAGTALHAEAAGCVTGIVFVPAPAFRSANHA